MPSAPLTPETEKRIALLFPLHQQELVRQLVTDDCGNNLPFLSQLGSDKLDRFRFAVLKLSQGDLDKLYSAIRLAKSDWRDLLMSAGFGRDIHAHEAWMPPKQW